MYENRWNDFFEKEHELRYSPITMYQMVKNCAEKHPYEHALEFQGKKINYIDFIERVENVARSLTAIGIREGDAVTICMPNCPQAIETFYAINRIGAIANMIHPLSAQAQINFYLNISESKVILTLDQFYDKVVAARADCDHQVTIIVARIIDELPEYLKLPYLLTNKQYWNIPNQPYSVEWKEFIHYGKNFPLPLPKITYKVDRPAVILYSGGSTGVPKGILLSDLNFNACSMQSYKAMDVPWFPGAKVLAVMPLFHGFGLGISIHTCITHGICCCLIPQFTVKTYAKTLLKKKPSFIPGVPTLFEALLKTKGLDKADLSFLKGMYCGGDSLSVELKHEIDNFLKAHHGDLQVREGYGATECVNASCLTPLNEYKEKSIGIPYPDTKYVICKPETIEELPKGQEGEICLSGPSVMLGYLNNDAETADTLKIHADGNVYLHTGDLGYIDEDNYVFYKQRIKRMIISSGYNVYPSQIESIINSNPKVLLSCAIGIPDSYKVQAVKVFVVLKPNVIGDNQMKKELLDYCKKYLAKYEMPKEIEFRDDLPKTLVGKVNFKLLEEEELNKINERKKK